MCARSNLSHGNHRIQQQPQYLAFLLTVLAECAFAGVMLTLTPPLTFVDWTMAAVDIAFMALFLGRALWTIRIFKRDNTCALWTALAGAAMMAVILGLTKTSFYETFVLMGLFLVAATELHGLFEDRDTRITQF